MKWKDSNSEREMWDISLSHLRHLIPIKQKSLKQYRLKCLYPFSRSRLLRKHKIAEKHMVVEIKFLERELKYRIDYLEYRTFCELFVVGINEKNPDRPNSYVIRQVRNDESFILAFAGWCEDHGMMVQSRKLMRYLDRIKQRERTVKYQVKEGII